MRLNMQPWIFVGLVLLTMMMSISATAQEAEQPCTTSQLNHAENIMHGPVAKPINNMPTGRPENMSIYLDLASRRLGPIA